MAPRQGLEADALAYLGNVTNSGNSDTQKMEVRMEISGKKVVVIGGASGMGRATA